MQSRYPFVRELGDGQTVVCLHSSTSSHKQWLPLMMQLADRYRVMAVDLAGHGKKTWPGGSADALQEDLRLLEVVAGGKPVHLIGHSYGGALALRYALRDARGVRSLTLYEPAAWDLLLDDPSQDIFDLARDVESKVAAGNFSTAARVFVDYWNGAGSWDRLAPFHQERIAQEMKQVVAHFSALFTDPLSLSAYASLRMPVLLLSGELGPQCGRRTSRLLADAMRGAALKVFPTAGHMGPMTSPYAVNDAIEQFLDRVAEPVRQAA